MTRVLLAITYLAVCFGLGYAACEFSWLLLLCLPPLAASYVALDRAKARPVRRDRIREEVRW